MKAQSNEQIAVKVSVVTMLANTVLSILKFFAGIAGNSSAMVSDAVHSMSDVLSTLVVIAGVKLSGRRSDSAHPYGHERFECVAALMLSVMLGSTGAGIGVNSLHVMLHMKDSAIACPSMIALSAAIVSILSKEAMYWYTVTAARKISSGALLADAWHHRSDALSSVGSLIGILGARLGFSFFDPLAGLIICIFILKVAADIFKDAVHKMTDSSCDEETVERLRALILEHSGVRAVDSLKTRLFGSKVYIDVEIAVDKDSSLIEAHQVAQEIHDAIESKFPEVKHCMVHVNPYYCTEEKY